MAHNPSYVSRTHVVTAHSNDDRGGTNMKSSGCMGIMGPRETIDQHINRGEKNKVKAISASVGRGEKAYTHPETDLNEPYATYYHIHRDEGGGKFKKV